MTTYELAYSGTSTHYFDLWECPGQVCAVPSVTSPFSGVLDLSLPEGDGSFIALSIAPLGLSPLEPLEVTVAGGQVVGLNGTAFGVGLGHPQFWDFTGLSLAVNESTLLWHYGPTYASATLFAIPEPAIFLSLLLGIGMMVWRKAGKGI